MLISHADPQNFAPQNFAPIVADWLLTQALATTGPFAICLSGGTTPRRLYEHLATIENFPWHRTHLFWGDERFVPHTAPLSNYRMVQEALLTKIPIPAQNIHPIPHPIPTSGTPEDAARTYEQTLKSFYGAETLDPARPLFDVTLLGLGTDGHTASLFPNTAVLTDRTHWAAAVIGAKTEPRITLTYPALESSRHIAFLIQGEDKREILTRLRAGDQTLPAAHLKPGAKIHIFTDLA